MAAMTSYPSMAVVEELNPFSDKRSSSDDDQTLEHTEQLSVRITPDVGETFTLAMERTNEIDPDAVHVTLDEPMDKQLRDYKQAKLDVSFVHLFPVLVIIS